MEYNERGDSNKRRIWAEVTLSSRSLNGRESPLSILKICFAASSGGHFEQLMRLKPLMDKYDSFLMTERTDYLPDAGGKKIYYLWQVNRRETGFPFRMLVNVFKSLRIYRKEKPDVVICTGVLAMIPICLIAKLHRKKLVYIESYAKVSSGTETGRFLYKYADRFYIQWKALRSVYPGGRYVGGIY